MSVQISDDAISRLFERHRSLSLSTQEQHISTEDDDYDNTDDLPPSSGATEYGDPGDTGHDASALVTPKILRNLSTATVLMPSQLSPLGQQGGADSPNYGDELEFPRLEADVASPATPFYLGQGTAPSDGDINDHGDDHHELIEDGDLTPTKTVPTTVDAPVSELAVRTESVPQTSRHNSLLSTPMAAMSEDLQPSTNEKIMASNSNYDAGVDIDRIPPNPSSVDTVKRPSYFAALDEEDKEVAALNTVGARPDALAAVSAAQNRFSGGFTDHSGTNSDQWVPGSDAPRLEASNYPYPLAEEVEYLAKGK